MTAKWMRPRRAHALIGCLLLLIASGCATSAPRIDPAKLNVSATIYPLADFAAKIGGDRVHVIPIVPAGVEPHDWSPSLRDISVMSRSQLLLYQGSGMEAWVDDFRRSLPSDAPVKALEVSAGIAQHHDEAEAEHADEGLTGHLGRSGEQLDPHTWLSPVLAKQMAAKIKDALIAVDPDYRTEYETNYEKLADRLDALDLSYRQALAALPHKAIVVQHAAFGYLCREYGLSELAIMGLTPDAEPTARQMRKIKQFVLEHQVRVIFFEELVSDKLAKTLAEETGVRSDVLSPIEGRTPEQAAAGEDYFSLMERNLLKLQEALR
jgi:zinc transport system substrate-binding protein